jgi:hypothetical protein
MRACFVRRGSNPDRFIGSAVVGHAPVVSAASPSSRRSHLRAKEEGSVISMGKTLKMAKTRCRASEELRDLQSVLAGSAPAAIYAGNGIYPVVREGFSLPLRKMFHPQAPRR